MTTKPPPMATRSFLSRFQAIRPSDRPATADGAVGGCVQRLVHELGRRRRRFRSHDHGRPYPSPVYPPTPARIDAPVAGRATPDSREPARSGHGWSSNARDPERMGEDSPEQGTSVKVQEVS